MTQSSEAPYAVAPKRPNLVSGSIWTVLGFGTSKALQLLSNLILTRLLFPEAFGLMALVNVFIAGMYMLSDVGITPAIIQMQDVENSRFLSTAWTLQIIRGFVLWAIMCLIAYPVSAIYREPQLFPLLCFSGSACAVSGFKSINVALADRNLEIKKSISIQLIPQVVAIIAMVSLALVIDSVWALAIGTVLGQAVGIGAGYFVLSGHQHYIHFDKESASRLFHFGKWIFWSTLFTYAGGQGIRVIEGMFVSMSTLGVIAVAGTLALALSQLVEQFQGKIMFPVLSSMNRESPERFAAMLKKMRLRILLLTIPLFSIVSLSSNLVVGVLYDDRYALAGPFLAVLSIHGAIQVLPLLYQTALMAQADTRLHFRIVTVTSVLRICGMLAGASAYGVLGMLVGTMLGSLLSCGYVAVLVKERGWFAARFDLGALAVILLVSAVSYGLNVSAWLPKLL